jgi:Transcriptional regulatory protein, C terminal/FHA domain
MALLPAPRMCLEVHAPDGRTFEVELAPGRVHVGRAAPGYRPDVVLDPDPQRWVGRLHCCLDYENGAWWLSDNGTINGTFLRRGERTERVLGRERLQDQDVTRILGGMTDGDELRYWDLTLKDPYATRRAPAVAPAVGSAVAPAAPDGASPRQPPECVEYDWVQAKLYRRRAGERREVGDLSPLAHKLVRYMADRGRANGWVPVACTHEELIRAVWADGDAEPYGFTTEHLRDLVSELRKRLEPERQKGAASRLLETVPGIGYRLVVCRPEGAGPPR